MTVDEVKARVEEIRAAASDDEAAHVAEDALYRDVLKHHAANGCPLAAAALSTKALDFARWCA